MAAKLEPYVQGGTKESGDFMLVTVSMGPANVVNLIAAQFNKYTHISKAEEILQKVKVMKNINFAKIMR